MVFNLPLTQQSPDILMNSVAVHDLCACSFLLCVRVCVCMHECIITLLSLFYTCCDDLCQGFHTYRIFWWSGENDACGTTPP